MNAFFDGQDVRAARAIQQEIPDGYTSDFAKHASPRLLARAMLARESIPGHLFKQNKKLVFVQVRKNARAIDSEESLIGAECSVA